MTEQQDKHPKRCETCGASNKGCPGPKCPLIIADPDVNLDAKCMLAYTTSVLGCALHSSSGSPCITERQGPESPQQGYPGIRYYPISEGELRSILDMNHIPKNPTSNDVFRANTQILAMILNRDSIDTEHDKETRVTLIRQILKWREDNRGKKVGYCTNGMIEDAFLTELIDRDYWDPKEHDAAIAAQATATEQERMLDELKKYHTEEMQDANNKKTNCDENTHWFFHGVSQAHFFTIQNKIKSLRSNQPGSKQEREPE